MRMIIATLMLAISGYFLHEEYVANLKLEPAAPEAPAVVTKADLAPMLDGKQLANLRQALTSGEANVRWAAMQTLFTVNDPKIMTVLESAMTLETDPQMRVGIVLMLKTCRDPNALKVLSKGVRDTDPVVRVAALNVIGEVGDMTATPIVAAAVNDSEEGVKLAAMSALASLNQRRKAEYEELTGRLRHQYEEQVKKTQEKAG
ncbi:MAG: HEAT repeat domain-containing protein [Elusimicrobia bacterium]|nr:HEAT repeat domain-containing protein [Elusimicrobiota bacterium]